MAPEQRALGVQSTLGVLAQAGFHAGQQVTVTLRPNGLIIIKNKKMNNLS